MNIELWKLVLSAAGLILTTVTGPLLWALRAESRRIRGDIQLEMEKMDKNLRLEMKDMEKRLNERIDTRLVHR